MSQRSQSLTMIAWGKLKRNKAAMASFLFLIVLALVVIFGPMLIKATWGYTYNSGSDLQYAAPNSKHWFGTDIHGRDLMVRVLKGAQISLMVGFVGALVSLVVGVIYGMVSGYFGGKTDEVMMRIVDILYSLPRLIFVMVLITVLDEIFANWLFKNNFQSMASYSKIILLFVGLGLMEWLTMARIVRGQVLALKERTFILASRSLGASPLRVLFSHLLPNLVGVIIVYLTLTVPVVILEESLLSFLGLGVQAPHSSWGVLISDGAKIINPVKSYWWLLVFPGVAMSLTLLALNFLGDGLRDAFDPRQQK
ncbi:MAG: ABC transporter permease [Verrucomicrobiota bacterium]|nr:ABC transporter permease [Verrucomicrobiota bacterium]